MKEKVKAMEAKASFKASAVGASSYFSGGHVSLGKDCERDVFDYHR